MVCRLITGFLAWAGGGEVFRGALRFTCGWSGAGFDPEGV